jgi:exopolysaccharide biosynthesis protein
MFSIKNVVLSLAALLLLLSGLRSAYLPAPLNIQLTALAGPTAGQGTFTQWTTASSTPGVVLMQRRYANSLYGNQVVNVLDVDPTAVTFRTVETQYPTKYETVLSMGKRTNAVAGINGGFFCYTSDDICGSTACTDAPVCPKDTVYGRSLLRINGQKISSNCALRTSFGITELGAPKVQQVGSGQDWPGTVSAIGAGPNLVTDRIKHITQEGFCWYNRKAARTSVSTTSEGHILLITIDGVYLGADGMTIDDLANFLIGDFHVVSAMNFDGGGSTTMYFGGQIVNRPSDQSCNGARCVYDGLFVYAK